MREPERGFLSRKFITTNNAMILGVAVMVFGVLAKAPEGFWSALPAFFLLLGGGIASYNWANLRESQNGHAPRPKTDGL